MTERATFIGLALGGALIVHVASARADEGADAVPAFPPVAPVAIPSPPDEHEQFVHHFAIGYLGLSSLPIAATGTPGAPAQVGSVNAPVIGARYWFSSRLGLDAGFGLGLLTGSEQPTSFGFALHAGLPIALRHAPHYTVELIPEVAGGFTTGSIAIPSQSDATVGGQLIRAGARAGVEIHFGFIGIPQLALQASLGLYYSYQRITYRQGSFATSGTSSLLTTSVEGAPWAIFTNSVSALYYF